MDNPYSCPLCAAELATKDDLDQHEKLMHVPPVVSSAAPATEYARGDEAGKAARKDRTFTRRHPE
jgi:hypothetical protein